MDDWQDAAFTSRHVHNRANKSKKGGGRGRRGGAFEVKRAFGRYDIKCPSATKLRGQKSEGGKGKSAGPSMDIFRLSEDGRGLLGQLNLPGVLDASIILTGSRKVLEDLISQFEGSDEEADISDDPNEKDGPVPRHHVSEDEAKADNNLGTAGGYIDKEEEEVNEESEDEEESEAEEQKRFKNFEKNSFRSPKFWFQWNGDVTPTATPSLDNPTLPTPTEETGRGYVVFSGNDCRSFKGTISCDSLGWKDVSISGWKEVSMSERDVSFVWK
ncbi:catalase [Colletotrichum melonis]|uniref:Catalase n=1 Tax=Colletotrichum melonis TaxID=1209925 RepID=A0AAI9UAN5_9PEZI|nr:catalase [Colletotrichum melonis]